MRYIKVHNLCLTESISEYFTCLDGLLSEHRDKHTSQRNWFGDKIGRGWTVRKDKMLRITLFNDSPHITVIVLFFNHNIYNGSKQLQHNINWSLIITQFFYLQLWINDQSRQTQHPVFLQQQTSWSVNTHPDENKEKHIPNVMIPALSWIVSSYSASCFCPK
jgi:hypothetical protein